MKTNRVFLDTNILMNDCYYLLTLNIKDFRHFQSIVVVHPIKYKIMVI